MHELAMHININVIYCDENRYCAQNKKKKRKNKNVW